MRGCVVLLVGDKKGFPLITDHPNTEHKSNSLLPQSETGIKCGIISWYDGMVWYGHPNTGAQQH